MKEYEPTYESKSAILKTIWADHAFGMTIKKESTRNTSYFPTNLTNPSR